MRQGLSSRLSQTVKGCKVLIIRCAAINTGVSHPIVGDVTSFTGYESVLRADPAWYNHGRL